MLSAGNCHGGAEENQTEEPCAWDLMSFGCILCMVLTMTLTQCAGPTTAETAKATTTRSQDGGPGSTAQSVSAGSLHTSVEMNWHLPLEAHGMRDSSEESFAEQVSS